MTDNTYILALNAFADTAVQAIARSQVKLAHENRQAARENYLMHVSAMDEGERVIFDRLIAIEALTWVEMHEREVNEARIDADEAAQS